MLRWLGALLILSGGLLTRYTLLREGREAQRVRRELAEDFEAMEAEIRTLLTPLPTLLCRRRNGRAQGFFHAVSEALGSDVTLTEAWRAASAGLPLREAENAQIAAMSDRLGGIEEEACAVLRLTAEALRRSFDRVEAARPARERSITILSISISLFLAIVLL